VERLAAISLAASPSDISELVMQGKVPGIQFTCFTSTKVQIATPAERIAREALNSQMEMTSTKVQILTPEALLVQKYKY
jgi:hypothetical protein